MGILQQRLKGIKNAHGGGWIHLSVPYPTNKEWEDLKPRIKEFLEELQHNNIAYRSLFEKDSELLTTNELDTIVNLTELAELLRVPLSEIFELLEGEISLEKLEIMFRR
jgi:hypothetical protein